MGNDDLIRGVELIAYEIASFAGSLCLRLNVPPGNSPAESWILQAAQNGEIELRVLHARVLLELLGVGKPNPKEYRANEYFPDWSAPEREELGRLYGRACRDLAHLSKKRVTEEEHATGRRDKTWPPSIFFPLVRATLAFVERLIGSPYVVAHRERNTLVTAQDLFRRFIAGASVEGLATGPTGPNSSPSEVDAE